MNMVKIFTESEDLKEVLKRFEYLFTSDDELKNYIFKTNVYNMKNKLYAFTNKLHSRTKKLWKEKIKTGKYNLIEKELDEITKKIMKSEKFLNYYLNTISTLIVISAIEEKNSLSFDILLDCFKFTNSFEDEANFKLELVTYIKTKYNIEFNVEEYESKLKELKVAYQEKQEKEKADKQFKKIKKQLGKFIKNGGDINDVLKNLGIGSEENGTEEQSEQSSTIDHSLG